MNKLRSELQNGFTIIPNQIVTDSALSWKAKGILLYLASKPDGWDFYVEEIKKNATDGKTSVKSGLKELTDSGYLRRDAMRDDGGQFVGWEWVLLPGKTANQANESTSGKPGCRETGQVENPADGKPTTNNTNNNKTKNNKTKPHNGRAGQLIISEDLAPDLGEEKEYYVPGVEDVRDYFNMRDEMIPKDIPLEAEKFVAHYEEREWKNSSGKRIKYWRRQAGTWINRYKQFQEKRIKAYHDEKESEKNTIGHAERLNKKFDEAWGD